jgi:hypothetical protein
LTISRSTCTGASTRAAVPSTGWVREDDWLAQDGAMSLRRGFHADLLEASRE